MVNEALFKKELKEARGRFLFCFLLLTAVAIVSVLAYPRLEELLSATSGESSGLIMGFSGVSSLEITELSFSLYLWSQWSATYIYLLGILAAIIFSAGAFAQEKAHGTLVFLASTPLTRTTIYDSKALAGLTLLAICIFGSTVILLLISFAAGFALPALLFLASALIAFLGATIVYLFTLIFSMFTSDAVKAGISSLLLCMILAIPGWFPASREYSLFYHLQSWDLYYHNQFPLLFFLTMLLLAAALYRGGLILWQRLEIGK